MTKRVSSSPFFKNIFFEERDFVVLVAQNIFEVFKNLKEIRYDHFKQLLKFTDFYKFFIKLITNFHFKIYKNHFKIYKINIKHLFTESKIYRVLIKSNFYSSELLLRKRIRKYISIL